MSIQITLGNNVPKGLICRMMKSIHDQAYRLLIGMLKEARKKQKVTQAEMAERIDSDQTYISKVETMERRIDVIELRTMCKALNVGFVEFIREFEDRLREKGVL